MSSVNPALSIEKSKDRIIRMKEVINRVGLSRSTIYKWMGEGRFPNSIQICPGVVGWYESVVNEWISKQGTQESLPFPDNNRS